MMELVAPAGNYDKLYYAYTYGADAAYIGLKNFSLRVKADNFYEQEYQRMNHLLTMRGKAGNNAELAQLRKNVAERKKIVANPQLRLDAIRLLVCR